MSFLDYTGLQRLVTNIKGMMNNLVHTVGNETIGGNKTFTGATGTKTLTGITVAADGGVIDVSGGQVFTVTVSSDLSITFTNPLSGCSCISIIMVNGGNYNVTWPANVKWTDDVPPELTENGNDVITLLTPDSGTTWYGCQSVSGVTA